MTAYNNHLLSQGAIAVARESAAREQRAKDAALLRREADKAKARAASWSKSAAGMDEHGPRAGAWADRDEARIQTRVMQALRDAAARIEAGEQ